MYSTLWGPISISWRMRAPVLPLYLGLSVEVADFVWMSLWSVDIRFSLRSKSRRGDGIDPHGRLQLNSLRFRQLRRAAGAPHGTWVGRSLSRFRPSVLRRWKVESLPFGTGI